jgi:hypothetical protein
VVAYQLGALSRRQRAVLSVIAPVVAEQCTRTEMLCECLSMQKLVQRSTLVGAVSYLFIAVQSR